MDKARNHKKNLEIFDITVPLDENTLIFTGDDRFSPQLVSSHNKGDAVELNNLLLPLHNGTHIDAPLHIIKNGHSIDYYPAERFICDAIVVEIEDAPAINMTHIKDIVFRSGQAILFKTKNSRSGLLYEEITDDFCSISKEVAEYLVQFAPPIVGIDYLSPDALYSQKIPVHHIFLENDILILESIDLRNVPAGNYRLYCLPLRLSGLEASPVRAILTY